MDAVAEVRRAGAKHELTDVALPADALALATLSRVDYTDCFLLAGSRLEDLTAEEWADWHMTRRHIRADRLI